MFSFWGYKICNCGDTCLGFKYASILSRSSGVRVAGAGSSFLTLEFMVMLFFFFVCFYFFGSKEDFSWFTIFF